jgi:hypothetical protein
MPTHRDETRCDEWAFKNGVSGLEGEQPIEEGSVARERLAKILGGNVVALALLIFQLGTLGAFGWRDLFHCCEFRISARG